MKIASLVSIVFTGLVANQLWINDAFAYLDPGTGSALLQGLLAALAAIVVTAKLYWHRLLRFFGFRKKTDAGQATVQSKSENAKNNEDA